jgi:hypothetical protein
MLFILLCENDAVLPVRVHLMFPLISTLRSEKQYPNQSMGEVGNENVLNIYFARSTSYPQKSFSFRMTSRRLLMRLGVCFVALLHLRMTMYVLSLSGGM